MTRERHPEWSFSFAASLEALVACSIPVESHRSRAVGRGRVGGADRSVHKGRGAAREATFLTSRVIGNPG